MIDLSENRGYVAVFCVVDEVELQAGPLFSWVTGHDKRKGHQKAEAERAV